LCQERTMCWKREEEDLEILTWSTYVLCMISFLSFFFIK
jgi:hypothetical protein